MSAISSASFFRQVLASDERRMVVIRQTPFLFAAVNQAGHAALFVRVSLGATDVLDDGQGFSVHTVRSGNENYVQITASERGMPPLFVGLVDYILDRTSGVTLPGEGARALIRSIEDYRRFVGRRGGRLSPRMVRASFAELHFLRILLDLGMPAPDAVSAWRGPWARAGLGLHDFTFPSGRGLEVKSTHQPPGAVRVSSLVQLVPSDLPLDLLVLPVEVAPQRSPAAIPFRKYALETGALMEDAGTAALDKWEAALAALNLDLGDEWYDRFRFVPGLWQRFKVVEGFPHLDAASVPLGIVDVRYSLPLFRLTPFSAPLSDLLAELRTP